MIKRREEEWKAWYERKTGLEWEENPRYRTYYFADRGLAQFAFTKDMVVLNQVSGDGRFWKQAAEILARTLCCRHLGTWCIRKIESYMRLFGYEIEYVEELDGGLKRYHCRNKATGQAGLASPSFMTKAGKLGYMITWTI